MVFPKSGDKCHVRFRINDSIQRDSLPVFFMMDRATGFLARPTLLNVHNQTRVHRGLRPIGGIENGSNPILSAFVGVCFLHPQPKIVYLVVKRAYAG
jgi:hypothetical protein